MPEDALEFNEESIKKLYNAGQDLYYLINHGYKIKGASTFVGNHYLLSERQRLALVRAISTEEDVRNRQSKELKNLKEHTMVNIDGFNTIITLEVALSGSLLLKCMDGTVRDLAGLRGTYRVIDKTLIAIKMIGETLQKYKIGKAVFYLDAPVSNSGRLKELICDTLSNYIFEVEVIVIHNVDSILEKLDYVVTSDAIILDKCASWLNLNKIIIENCMDQVSTVEFSKL